MKTREINNHDDKWRKGAAEFDLGMDAGSVSVKLVVMSPAGEVLKEEYRRRLGQPQRTALESLTSLEPEFPLRNCRLAAFTGLGGQVLTKVLGGALVNEVIAQARGTCHFRPGVRTIIDMGGEDARLVNSMPFTCMPGTVVNSLIGRFREEHDHIPFLNLAYDAHPHPAGSLHVPGAPVSKLQSPQ